MYVKPGCISLSLDVHVSSVSNYWWVISSSPYVHNEKPVIINYRSDHNIISFQWSRLVSTQPTTLCQRIWEESLSSLRSRGPMKGMSLCPSQLLMAVQLVSYSGSVNVCVLHVYVLISSRLLQTIPQPTSLSPSNLSDTLLNVTVPITDDSVYELQETFSAMLTTTDPGVVISTNTASATINDNDSRFAM